MSSSSDNAKPWYKKPEWWLVILSIPVAIAVIIGIFDWEDHTILISDPQEYKEVTYRYTVSGASNVNPNSKLNIYVLIKPLDSPLPWYVQPPATIQSNGDWETDAYFGRDIEDRGHYKVCAIISAKELSTSQTFEKIPRNEGVSRIITVKHTFNH